MTFAPNLAGFSIRETIAMSTLTKEQTYAEAKVLPLRQGWRGFEPRSGGEGRDGLDAAELRIALGQAETIMRIQKERIEALEERMLTDELTGLPNRRGFLAAFKRELAMARRDADYAGVLAMISFEDCGGIGPQAECAYACAAADALRQSVRANDTVARWDEDTFAVLLTHMDEMTGVARLEKLEKFLGKKTILPERLPLRTAIGFAAYMGTSSADAVIQTASLRLRAKETGGRFSTSAG